VKEEEGAEEEGDEEEKEEEEGGEGRKIAPRCDRAGTRDPKRKRGQKRAWRKRSERGTQGEP